VGVVADTEDVRDLIPYIFWPWFGLSCFILLRRRVTGGSWRATAPQETPSPIEFPPPPPNSLSDAEWPDAEPESPVTSPTTVSSDPSDTAETADAAEATEAEQADAPGAVMTDIDPDRPRSRSLAEAVEGIAMPCDLAPLMGTGTIDPREVAFFTHGHQAATVGAALADELERLGYAISPLDERSIKAEQGPDVIEARLVSTELTSPEVMRELHPSAPADALVVELKLV
jgi:hypothetical protein